MKNEQLIKIMLREALGKFEIISEMLPMTNDILYKSISGIIINVDDMITEINRISEDENEQNMYPMQGQ